MHKYHKFYQNSDTKRYAQTPTFTITNPNNHIFYHTNLNTQTTTSILIDKMSEMKPTNILQ